MPNGSDRVTAHPLQELQPTKTIDDPEIKAWLALGTKTKKKGGGKKKKGMDHVMMPCFVVSYHMLSTTTQILLNQWSFGVVCIGKKEDKADESAEAAPQDSTNGATPKE